MFNYPEDSVLGFIPEGIENSNHDNELELQTATSLDKLKEWIKLSLQLKP
jgi:hypothetical protein